MSSKQTQVGVHGACACTVQLEKGCNYRSTPGHAFKTQPLPTCTFPLVSPLVTPYRDAPPLAPIISTCTFEPGAAAGATSLTEEKPGRSAVSAKALTAPPPELAFGTPPGGAAVAAGRAAGEPGATAPRAATWPRVETLPPVQCSVYCVALLVSGEVWKGLHVASNL